MMINESSRNRARTVGEPFTDAVDLPGWDGQSIWGYDLGTSSYFAQLWRNTTNKGDPDIWLSSVSGTLNRPECVALALVERLNIDAVTAVEALALMDHDVQVRSRDEILRKIVSEELLGNKQTFNQAMSLALHWAAGFPTERTPGSLMSWSGGEPTAEQVHAEHCLVAGRLHQGQDREIFAACDAALWWSLKKTDELSAI